MEIQDVILDLDFSISDQVFLTQKIVFKLSEIHVIRDGQLGSLFLPILLD